MATTPYATLTDFAKYGLSAARTAGIANIDSIIEAAILSRSSFADSFLSVKFELPLVSWSEILSQMICQIVAWDILSVHVGLNPESPDGTIWFQRYQEGINWLRDVSKGAAILEAVDSTPPPAETSSSPFSGWFFSSDKLKGW